MSELHSKIKGDTLGLGPAMPFYPVVQGIAQNGSGGKHPLSVSGIKAKDKLGRNTHTPCTKVFSYLDCLKETAEEYISIYTNRVCE